jgi:hypothetical protein
MRGSLYVPLLLAGMLITVRFLPVSTTSHLIPIHRTGFQQFALEQMAGESLLPKLSVRCV